MRKFVRILLIFCFYQIKFVETPINDHDTLWKFKFYPRTWFLILAIIVASPIIILIGGIFGVIDIFNESNVVVHSTRYQIKLSHFEKPNMWKCYSKF